MSLKYEFVEARVRDWRALTVLYVPYSLNSGWTDSCCCPHLSLKLPIPLEWPAASYAPTVGHTYTPARTDCCCCPRCPANMAFVRQPRPAYGLGYQAQVLETFKVIPSSLGSETSTSASTILILKRADTPRLHGFLTNNNNSLLGISIAWTASAAHVRQ